MAVGDLYAVILGIVDMHAWAERYIREATMS